MPIRIFFCTDLRVGVLALAALAHAFPAASESPGGLQYLRVGSQGAPLYANPGGPAVAQAEGGAVMEGAPGPAGWLRIAAGEQTLWLRTTDGVAVEPATMADGALPDGLQCFGVEPFWSLTVSADRVRFGRLGDDAVDLRLLSATGPAPGFGIVRFAGAQAGRAEIQRRDCSDGMSDALFPWSVDLTMEVADAPPRLSGCCRFAPPTP